MWGVVLRWLKRRPVVFECMEDFESYVMSRPEIPRHLRRLLRAFVSAWLRIAAKKCDAVIFADQGTADRFRSYAQRIEVVYNFPMLSMFRDDAKVKADKTFDIVYHGSLSRILLERMFEIDTELVRRGHYLKWSFVGRVPDPNWYARETDKVGRRERFHLTDLVSHTLIAGEVVKGALGIIPLPNLPKYQNNIPQKMFEYMALRIPFVTSDLPPSQVFLRGKPCALVVPPGDVAGFADALVQLHLDPVLRKTLGDEGRMKVEQQFNWETESRKLLKLYADLTSANV
jgi:glycosyltransferase involved in cell wall biosynthesis